MEKKELLVLVLIGILLVTSGIQAVQLVGLSRAEIVVPTATGATVSSPASSPISGTPSVPANLENLPSMVGGC